LLPELRALTAAGHEVVLLPVHFSAQFDPELPAGVVVDGRLSEQFRSVPNLIALAGIVGRSFFWKELWTSKRFLIADPRHLLRFAKESLRLSACLRLGSWLADFDVCYTYWFTGQTAGLVLSPHVRGMRITRAHGYDLYLERECNRGYIPYRDKVIRNLDAIVLWGEEARKYLADNYALPASMLVKFPLGVSVQARGNPLSDTRCIEVASCSYPHSVKRLPLIGCLVTNLAYRLPDKVVRWTHFGCHQEDVAFAASSWPANLRLNFRGRVSPQEIFDYYQGKPVHFFLNLSESEGMPVSIMEAMSFGIPIVAPAVGGVPELVDSASGILLDKDPDINLVATLLAELLRDEVRYAGMRVSAQRRQQDYFDAKINHAKFANWIKTL